MLRISTTVVLIIMASCFDAKANDLDNSGQLQPVTKQAIKFDVSLPLHMYAPKPIVNQNNRGGLITDPGIISNDNDAPFVDDVVLQDRIGNLPGPILQSQFFAIDNVSGVSPPDPAGDVGPNHYVAMTNLSFSILDKSGNLLMGPMANNTVWSGFGGDCESDNSGDPIVLYDQISDRWMLSQFTSSSGPLFFNCIAISQTSDPTGAYYRWAILNNNGSNDLFPDYPKYGFWDDGLYISTRDFNSGSYAGVGVYAIDRDGLINGDPNPTIIYFFIDRSTDPWRVGDGLLPADIDGTVLPPPNSPQYFVGTMDDGAQYGAPSDALTFWEFDADFNTPSNSTFQLASLVPMSNFDTQFPCSGGRNCIPQAGTTNQVDIQSYRQRPLHRLAYRNFGSHESLVTNQSVEASAGIGGIRWWEIRNLSNPVLFQEGTFGPGSSDGVHRWMGSIAMDQDGNMGLAYSASSNDIHPAIRFTGRLVTDPLGSMERSEGSIIEGTGSQTGSQRWGDYTSTNIDPVDDCTFWHVNEYLDTNGGDWQIRVGSFKFNECGDPGFFLNSDSSTQNICVGEDAIYDLAIGSLGQFNAPVTLNESNVPSPALLNYSDNPIISLPSSTQITVTNTASVAAGNYLINILGTASGVDNNNIDLALNVFDQVPVDVTLQSPEENSMNVDLQPGFSWTDVGAIEYLIEVATDPSFNNMIYTDTVTGNTTAPNTNLASNTIYYWRIKALNSCGESNFSETQSFSTLALPGDCPLSSSTTLINYFDDFEAGAGSWTSTSLNANNSWNLSSAQFISGNQSYYVEDINSTSDTVLTSPVIFIPSGLSETTLKFWSRQSIESNGSQCWDGATLEVSNDGGTSYNFITNDKLLTDPYDGPFSSGLLTGVDAWCGDPQDWTLSAVDIADWAGQNVQFRFRMTTDVTVGREGWYIDDVTVQSCEIIDLIFEDGFNN